VGRFLIPTDGLWHGAIYYLEPSWVVNGQAFNGRADPFFAQGAPSWPYLLWVGCWFLIVLIAGMVSFERREL
jgi:hypothetical protein